MPQKMRMLFALFITLPFIFCLKKEETALLDKYSDFIKQVEENEGEFKEKTDEEKEKILKDLENSISDLNEQIKVYIQEKKESPKEKVLDLMKQAIEIGKYMKHKVCNKEDKNYEVCRGFKRKLMSNLLDVIEDNFGKCELTFEYVINLTEMPFVNLQYLTVLINSVMDNIDSIEKNKAEILSDLIKCLASYCIEYWPKVISNLKSKGKITLFTNLINTKAVEINDMQLGIVGLSAFGKTVVEQIDNKKEIETAIAQEAGKTMHVKIEEPQNIVNKTNTQDFGIPINIIDE